MKMQAPIAEEIFLPFRMNHLFLPEHLYQQLGSNLMLSKVIRALLTYK